MSCIQFGEEQSIVCGCVVVPCGDCDPVRCRIIASCNTHNFKTDAIISFDRWLVSRTELKGWARPLPAYLEQAVQDGILSVNEAKGYQYLLGVVTNPEGTVIEFQ